MKQEPAPGPYNYQIVQTADGPRGHVYLIDANGRKIGVIWGPWEEKQATADLICALTERQVPLPVPGEGVGGGAAASAMSALRDAVELASLTVFLAGLAAVASACGAVPWTA